MTENQRLKILQEKLGFKRQVEFAAALNISAGGLSDILREKPGVGVSANVKIILDKSYNVNISWLETGKGQMFKSEEHAVIQMAPGFNERSVVYEENEPKKGVPYYDIDVNASVISGLSDVREDPEFYVDYKPFNDCTAYLPVYGDSMYPKYQSGEVIAVKQIKNQDYIQWGEAHLIITNSDTNNMRVIKTIHPCEADPTKIILRSSNPNFKGDTLVPKDSVLSLYMIKGKVTRNQM